jgi:hypothetical protein
VDLALTPRFLSGLSELPIVKPGAEAAGHGLGDFRALVVAEAVVGQPQGFRQHPALAVVLIEEGVDSLLAVAAAAANLLLQVRESQ